MREYELSEFLTKIENLSFAEAFQQTIDEHNNVELLAKRESKKRQFEQDTRPIQYLRQLSGLLFWFHSGTKAAGLSEDEFNLIKPLCENLVKKGNLKSSALEAFDNVEEKS